MVNICFFRSFCLGYKLKKTIALFDSTLFIRMSREVFYNNMITKLVYKVCFPLEFSLSKGITLAFFIPACIFNVDKIYFFVKKIQNFMFPTHISWLGTGEFLGTRLCMNCGLTGCFTWFGFKSDLVMTRPITVEDLGFVSK